jgi:alpha-methylacyl-CoA racemase
MTRNRPFVELDLKDPTDLSVAQELVAGADILVEGFRPGVMERLGLGPEQAEALNPRVIYARMTGWGQTGPRSHTAGHDLTYIAVTGALHVATRAGGTPTPPANLLGDFGGGGFYLATAVLAAVVARQRTGRGIVLDVGVMDGTTYLTSMLHEYRAEGRWSDTPASNRLDTGAPYYDVYPCADGRFVAVGALEEPFFRELLTLLGIDRDLGFDRLDPAEWPRLRTLLAEAILARTRDEWSRLAAGTDACVAPVLDLGEAAYEEHMASRQVLRPRPDSAGWTPVLPVGHLSGADDLKAVLQRWGDLSERAQAQLSRGRS